MEDLSFKLEFHVRGQDLQWQESSAEPRRTGCSGKQEAGGPTPSHSGAPAFPHRQPRTHQPPTRR